MPDSSSWVGRGVRISPSLFLALATLSPWHRHRTHRLSRTLCLLGVMAVSSMPDCCQYVLSATLYITTTYHGRHSRGWQGDNNHNISIVPSLFSYNYYTKSWNLVSSWWVFFFFNQKHVMKTVKYIPWSNIIIYLVLLESQTYERQSINKQLFQQRLEQWTALGVAERGRFWFLHFLDRIISRT